MNKTVYAVRIWASTGDIKMVSDEIGHSSLVMTEKYADFEIIVKTLGKIVYVYHGFPYSTQNIILYWIFKLCPFSGIMVFILER